jgi:hypothetical protein
MESKRPMLENGPRAVPSVARILTTSTLDKTMSGCIDTLFAHSGSLLSHYSDVPKRPLQNPEIRPLKNKDFLARMKCAKKEFLFIHMKGSDGHLFTQLSGRQI